MNLGENFQMTCFGKIQFCIDVLFAKLAEALFLLKRWTSYNYDTQETTEISSINGKVSKN